MTTTLVPVSWNYNFSVNLLLNCLMTLTLNTYQFFYPSLILKCLETDNLLSDLNRIKAKFKTRKKSFLKTNEWH